MCKLKYSVITEIKKSNKSNVYLAAVEHIQEPVVVKEIIHGNIDVFKALKEMSSEHLPKIYHFEETEEGLLVVEEYVDGELLADILDYKKLTEEECLGIAEQICVALDILHSHKPSFIHRDIKPSNMIVTSKGSIKLIDYDSSRLYKEEAEGDTRLLGTEKYAAPEQYGFSQTDCRSDIYSLGVVLEKFTVYLSDRKKKAWTRLVEKCTLFSPDSRYQSVTEVRDCIKKIRKIGKFNIKIAMVTMAMVVGAVITILLCIDGNSSVSIGNSSYSGVGEVDSMENTSDKLLVEVTMNKTEMQEINKDNTTQADSEINTENNTEDATDYLNILKPEFRDLETDDETIIALKEEIREHCAVVLYHFKDRMQKKDFLYQVNELESDNVNLSGLVLVIEKNNREVHIGEKYYKVIDNVIVISKDYMNSLEGGYYKLRAEMQRDGEQAFSSSVCLYVADSDALQEQPVWLQNTTFEYKLNSGEKIHLVIMNDSIRKFEGLYKDGIKIDESLYKVLQDGRVIELSSELLGQINSVGEVIYSAISTDGSNLGIVINVIE